MFTGCESILILFVVIVAYAEHILIGINVVVAGLLDLMILEQSGRSRRCNAARDAPCAGGTTAAGAMGAATPAGVRSVGLGRDRVKARAVSPDGLLCARDQEVEDARTARWLGAHNVHQLLDGEAHQRKAHLHALQLLPQCLDLHQRVGDRSEIILGSCGDIFRHQLTTHIFVRRARHPGGKLNQVADRVGALGGSLVAAAGLHATATVITCVVGTAAGITAVRARQRVGRAASTRGRGSRRAEMGGMLGMRGVAAQCGGLLPRGEMKRDLFQVPHEVLQTSHLLGDDWCEYKLYLRFDFVSV
mmetsp:Transcript_34261/g.58891  ORF Transcript_34261/g.58891 Transcript_34261/m.58891 type:complete len:303 (-) Transcript_34261:1808-2716(-)